jgi:excisionase family DNA binding protein
MKPRCGDRAGPVGVNDEGTTWVLVDRERLLHTIAALLDQFTREPASSNKSSYEPWISVSDAAEYASVSEDTLREWVARGWLPNRRVGRVQRVRRSDIDLLFEPGFSVLPENDQETAHPRSLEILGSITGKPDG